MAITNLTDIIVPEVFMDSVQELTSEKSELVRSGLVGLDPEFNDLASGKGTRVDMPFWKDLYGDSEVLDDTGALTPDNLSQGQDEAVIHRRGKAWGVNDLVGAVTGDDPVGRITAAVSRWRDRDVQRNVIIPSVVGIMGAGGPLASTHVLDANAATTNKGISAQAMIEAEMLLGDQWDGLAGIACHSAVFQDLRLQDLITFEPISEQEVKIPRYMGKIVFVDDGMPNSAGVCDTLLFGMGAFAWGMGGSPGLPPEKAVETDRDVLGGDDLLVYNYHDIIHPRGIRFTGTPVGVSPTKGELETAGNWTLAWEPQNIKMIKLVSLAGGTPYDGS